MDLDDLEPKPKPVHEIGGNLSNLSIDELRARVEVLKQEIARLEADIEAKNSSRAAAAAAFKI